MTKEETIERFKRAIKSQESDSSGGYLAYNKDSGAAGAYQFIQSTWDSVAKEAGYGNYAGMNATYAPPEVQDAVFENYASGLYDRYGGDIRYMANAHYAGIGAADEHYKSGILPTAAEGNYQSQASYSDNVVANMNSSLPDVSSTELDWSNLVHNHGGENSWTNIRNQATGEKFTDTDNLRAESKYGLNLLGKWYRDEFGLPLTVTGGAESWVHQSGEYSHHSGWKADVFGSAIKGGTAGGDQFKVMCNSLGYSANWEGDHWDIDFSGNDSRDTAPKGNLTGNFFALTGADNALAQAANGQFDPEGSFTDPYGDTRWDEKPSMTFWDIMTDNFLDSATSTGTAGVLQTLWGNIAHSSNHFGRVDDVSQEDLDFVKNALPNDKAAQEFCLLNGRDSEEIKWLVNQKLVDKNRRERINAWKTSNESYLQKFLVATAGGIGYLADPINLIPVGTTVNSLKVAGRLGTGLMDSLKAQQIARIAATNGVKTGAVTMADDLLKERFGGEKQNYGFDAAMGFLGGSVLSAIGGLWKGLSKGGTLEEVAKAGDIAETRAIQHAMDIDMTKVKSETIGEAMKIHDPNYGSTIKSKFYKGLEKSGKVIATTYDEAKKLIQSASGMSLPSRAKAFYVPNEDYMVILTDKIRPVDVDKIIAHEMGVHAGLKDSIGNKAYNELMDYVSTQAEKEGTVFFEARKEVGSYDPEEIFAQVVEEGKLPDTWWSRLKGGLNTTLNKKGWVTKWSVEQTKDIIGKQVEAKRNPQLFYQNEDGSTAFAGLRYSKDNLLNPARLVEFIQLEQAVTKMTQDDLKAGVFTKPLRWLGKHFEQGIFGEGINSVSNTIRKYTPLIWEDARGRGLGNVKTVSAETNKQRLTQLLLAPYIKAMEARQRWCLANKSMGESARMTFDKMVYSAYNAKYAGNVANAIKDIPKEVEEAIEHIHEMRKLQIELGKRSATDVGSDARNLIDEEWYEVDEELWRLTDNDRRSKFLVGNFIDTEEKSAYQHAAEFLEEYYRTFAKRDVIKAKLIRAIRMENAQIRKANEEMVARLADGDSKWTPKELKTEAVLDEDIDNYLDEHVEGAVEYLLNGVFDPTEAKNASSLGSLSFLKERIPIDTTGVLELPNGKQFSYDNDLRTFDLDDIVQKNISRFAGEASLLNVFKTQKEYESFLAKAKSEITTAVGQGFTNKDAYRQIEDLEKAIAEFRGVRYEHDTPMGRFGAFCKIMRNLAYAKNGANMGFNQFGELGGAMAYGGVSQVMRIFPKLGEFMENVKYGKASAEVLRDVEDYAFGKTLEAEIFTVNYGDRSVRDALTEKDSLVNKALIWCADKTANMGKLTSAINMLPKMTDSMVRGMRISTMMDSIRVSHGATLGKLRDPFTPAKLKAAHVSSKEWETIQEQIRKHTTINDGQVEGFEVKAWQTEDMNSYLKWYNLIQLQAERAIVSGSRQGNKNLFKSKNCVTELLMQFKDYPLRAINAQTMRAMTARDMDDAIATAASIVTNTAVYAARAGATYAAYKASGMDKKAEEYYDNMFNKGNLFRAIAFRSSFLGTPLSFGNDIYEALTGASSIRTTVDRRPSANRDRTAKDVFGDFISQLPAVREAVTIPMGAISAFDSATDDRMSKKDFRSLMKLLPIPNLIPWTVFQQHLVESSGLPESRPKR